MAPTATTTSIIEDYGILSLKSCDNFTNEFDKLKLSEAANNGALRSKQLIGEALKERAESIDDDTCAPGDEDAFFVADMGHVYRQHLRWKKNLKRVKPHYGKYLSAKLIDCNVH